MHTIVPIEQIFACTHAQIRPQNRDGVEIEFAIDEYGREQFSRLHTTNLAEYLKY